MYLNNRVLVDLGFTAEKLPHGTQVCQVFSQESERESALLAFIESGLVANERVACLCDKTTRGRIAEWLKAKGLNYDEFNSRSQLSFASSHDSHFDDNTFKPEPMLEVIKSFHQDSEREAQSGARVIIEMHPRIAEEKSVSKLLEYVAQLNLLQEEYPVTTVCQYSAMAFDGATIMKILKVHPLLAINNAIIRNPFYIPARDFLASGSETSLSILSTSSDLLAKLLIMQNMAALIPKSSLSDFVCEGLADFPGISAVSWEQEVPPAHQDQILLQLRYASSNFGTIKLIVSDFDVLNNYLQYLKNFAVMVALVLETKREQQEAKTTRDRFFELSPDLFCIANSAGYFTELSLSWERTLGRKREALCAEPYVNFIHPDDIAKTETTAEDVNTGQSVKGFTNRFRCADGSYRWLEWTSFPQEDGKIFAVARDITHRRDAQRELQLAASVYNHTSNGIFVSNLEGNIISVNPAFLRLTHYREEQVLNQNVSMFRDDDDDNSIFSVLPKTQLDNSITRESKVRKRRGDSFLALVNITSVHDDGFDIGETWLMYVIRDITAEKAHEEKIHKLALTDSLTGLANRTLFLSRLDQAVEKSLRSQSLFAVLFVDLDNFKSINDSLGHELGDEVLSIQARRLKGQVRKADTIARLGGDEFVILVEGVENENTISTFAQKVLTALSKPLIVERHKLQVTCAIGISLFPNDGKDRISIMRNADTAMYHAKEQGRNNFRYFSVEMTEQANKRLKLEMELRNAIANDQLVLHYQPKYNLKTGKINGAEALVRWQHPQRGLLYPGSFIQFAEETHLINDLGEWVIENTVKQIALWQEYQSLDFPIAINLSTIQFRQTDLTSLAMSICKKYRVPARAIEFEITESTLMDKPEKASSVLQQMRKLGFRIAIDDFGTGYSSLSYLKKLPLDILKIDRAFIKDLHRDDEDSAIVKSIIALSKGLKLELTAEGIDNEKHVSILINLGVESGQGFLFSKPVPPEDFLALYTKQTQPKNTLKVISND